MLLKVASSYRFHCFQNELNLRLYSSWCCHTHQKVLCGVERVKTTSMAWNYETTILLKREYVFSSHKMASSLLGYNQPLWEKSLQALPCVTSLVSSQHDRQLFWMMAYNNMSLRQWCSDSRMGLLKRHECHLKRTQHANSCLHVPSQIYAQLQHFSNKRCLNYLK